MQKSWSWATRVLSVIIAGTVVPASASTDLLVEPYVGYHFGQFETQSVSGLPNVDQSYNGAGFGIRLGVGGGVLFAAGDVHYAFSEIAGIGAEDDSEANRLLVGGVVGVKLDILRLWGGINIVNDFESDFPDGASTIDYGGMAYKLGIGLMWLPWVSLNVEYLLSPIDETCRGGECVELQGSEEISADSWFISLSLPLGG